MSTRPISIPIHAVGPGSQPEPEPANTIGVPDTVETFQLPRTPVVSDRDAALKCRDLFIEIYNEMKMWNPDSGEAGPAFALDRFDVETIRLIDQLLGEGEVSIKVTLPNDKFDEIRIQESIFVGIWRVRCYKDGKPITDQIEISPIPTCVPEAAYISSGEQLRKTEPREDAMNSPAILAELSTAINQWSPGSAAFTVNLSHLPVSPGDLEIIEDAIGQGSVHMISRGFGNCHIKSTGTRHVWKVQYFNNSPSRLLILNTVVVTGFPEEAIAASEDLQDSTDRVEELVRWVTKSWELPSVELQ